jgi:hypothetical protein
MRKSPDPKTTTILMGSAQGSVPKPTVPIQDYEEKEIANMSCFSKLRLNLYGLWLSAKYANSVPTVAAPTTTLVKKRKKPTTTVVQQMLDNATAQHLLCEGKYTEFIEMIDTHSDESCFDFKTPFGDPQRVSAALYASYAPTDLYMPLMRRIAQNGGMSVNHLLAKKKDAFYSDCALVRCMSKLGDAEWLEFDALLLKHIPDWNAREPNSNHSLLLRSLFIAKTGNSDRLDTRAATFVPRSLQSLNCVSSNGYYTLTAALYNGRWRALQELIKTYPLICMDPSELKDANSIALTLEVAKGDRNDYDETQGRDAKTQVILLAGQRYVEFYAQEFPLIVSKCLRFFPVGICPIILSCLNAKFN